MHAGDIAAALESLRQRLAREEIPFAVIGALALRHHGYVRHTEGIDILTTPEGLDRIHATIVGRRLVPRGPGLRKSLRETAHEVSIDVVTSGEHAGSPESPVEYPLPGSTAFVDVAGLRLPTLEVLVEFKIASGVWGAPAAGPGRRPAAHPDPWPDGAVRGPPRAGAPRDVPGSPSRIPPGARPGIVKSRPGLASAAHGPRGPLV